MVCTWLCGWKSHLLRPKPEVEPIHNPLQARLLDPPLMRLAHVASQRKTMLDTGEELQLVRLPVFLHHVDSLVTGCGVEGMVYLRARQK